MVALNWLRGLLAHRPTRVVATAVGVGVGVALIASIGTFLSSTNSKMTHRAIARVAVDWQAQAQPGASAAAVLSTVRAFPGVRRALPVQFAGAPEPHGHHEDRRRPPAPRACSACRRATSRPFPANCACSRALSTGCWSPNRPPRTCTSCRAAPSRSRAPARRRCASPSPASLTFPTPIRCSRASVRRLARRPRRPRTT